MCKLLMVAPPPALPTCQRGGAPRRLHNGAQLLHRRQGRAGAARQGERAGDGLGGLLDVAPPNLQAACASREHTCGLTGNPGRQEGDVLTTEQHERAQPLLFVVPAPLQP